MTPLEKIIVDHIRGAGPMDMGTYMALCLGHREHGYYMTRDPLGASGDFTTAPEISQLFGEMIGFWIADMYQQMGSPDILHLVECGPGRGTLMRDVTRVFRVVPELKAAVQIHFIETSPVLRELQTAGNAAMWHNDLSTVPIDAPMILIANEFFDALPIRQFLRDGDRVQEIVIGLHNDQLTLGRVPADSSVLAALPDDDGVYEPSSIRANYMNDICARVVDQGGAALIIDYGFLNPIRHPTVQALQKHQPVALLYEPGLVDLTSLVDFAALRTVASRYDVNVLQGTQGDFLRELGIQSRFDILAGKADEDQARDLNLGLVRLTAPDQMGDLFKVLCVASTGLHPVGLNDVSGD